jgi:hypothetical protein
MRVMGIFVGALLFALGGCVFVYGDLRDYAKEADSGTSSTGTGGGDAGCMPTSAVEVCGNGIDEDCQGGDCPSHTVDWSVRFGKTATGTEALTGIAMASGEGALLTGSYDKVMDLGGGNLVTTDKGLAAFAGAVDGSGKPLWLYDGKLSAKGASYSIGYDLSADTAAAIAGQVEGSDSDAFVARFETLGAPATWNVSLAWPGDQQSTGVVVGNGGVVFTVGTTSGTGTIDCGGVIDLDPLGGTKSLFVAALARDNGNCTWAKIFKGGTIEPTSIITSGGQLIVAGNYAGVITGTKVPPTPTQSATGAFVLALDIKGALQWSWGIAGTNANDAVKASAIAVDPGGRIYMTGSLAGEVVTPSGNLTSTSGSEDAIVFALDGQGNGAPIWAERFGGSKNQQGRGIVVQGSDVFVAGRAEDAMSVEPNSDNGVMCKGGGLFLMKLDSTQGKAAWGECFGEGSLDPGDSVALAASANSLVLGMSRKGDIRIGADDLTGLSPDVVVAKYSLSSL